MPQIFDNLTTESELLPTLQTAMNLSERADFCVGYFNLRGWDELAPHVDNWNENQGPCRILVGMQPRPDIELKEALRLTETRPRVDNQTALRLKQLLAEQMREQLTFGAPNNKDEKTLRQLATQLRSRKVVVKLFLRHSLHAKLYLIFRNDDINPIIGYLGSSNLTFAGLSGQGELNIDVLDSDATIKLKQWFEDRWNDRYCIDITDELADIIDESWARESLIPPYHIYLKIAYHLSHEARTGLAEFGIPSDFGNRLFDFQAAAVKIAAHHLNKRNGVIIGDVVGLGKTLMATALARIFEDDYGLETLIICPPNLVDMWEDYAHEYRMRAQVISQGKVVNELPQMRRYRLVIIDESHNFRNRNGRRYRAIQEYIRINGSKCILLSATPYNKTYLDLSNQLRLFVQEDRDIGIRPEKLLREIGEVRFLREHQASPRTLAAFEFSYHTDDWRDLMRLYMVRRTRSFIQNNYALTDQETGRRFITYEDGSKSYFPSRVPKTVEFAINENDPNDQYANLYSDEVVEKIRNLHLPRYGLGNYTDENPLPYPTTAEVKQLENLSRAGKRLIGFCRTNLFKRLESSGAAFLQSVERHILRNYIYLHAIQSGQDLPLGPQDAEMLDSRFNDEDTAQSNLTEQDDENISENTSTESIDSWDKANFEARATEVYAEYQRQYKHRFNWIRPDLFTESLEDELQSDADALLEILQSYGSWKPDHDAKMIALHNLLSKEYPNNKVLVFSQFADTVRYLEEQLKMRGIDNMASVTGDSSNPTRLAWRFSPASNDKRKRVSKDQELRILIATDLLSEGQNLQDCSIVVNYDLPWAIIRLIQRAGRVDRIGQTAEEILCHSFLPADGVEKLINLRSRVKGRLEENAEVVGTDEAFFEDDDNDQIIRDLYNEMSGILDDDADGEVDLASHAYQIWKNAIDADPTLEKTIIELPDVVFSSRDHISTPSRPEGVLMFMRTAENNDALAYIGQDGNSITESQLAILAAAACEPDTPARPHHQNHHKLVLQGVQHLINEEKSIGGQLGRPSSVKFRVYTRLKEYANIIKGQLFDTQPLHDAMKEIHRSPLRQSAVDTLSRQLRSGIEDPQLAGLVIALYQDDRLCIPEEEKDDAPEPRIICSMGMFEQHGEQH